MRETVSVSLILMSATAPLPTFQNTIWQNSEWALAW